VGARAAGAVGAGGSAAAVSLNGAGGAGGETSDGPPEHLSPGYGAGYDAGFQAGILAAAQGRAPQSGSAQGPAAAEGSAGWSAPEPARPPILALVEDFPDLFQKEVLERLDPHRSRSARAHGKCRPHCGDALRPAARRRQGGRAAGRHRVILPVPLDVRLGCGERLPVATCNHLQHSRRGRSPGGVTVGAGAWVPVERSYMYARRSGRAPGCVEVVAGARLPLEQYDVLTRRRGRAPGGVEVGAGAWLPVEL